MAIEILRRRPPSELYPSRAAVDLIRHFEGLSLTGYLDSIGKPTIGYGNTGPAAVVGARITLAEADALLDEDVAKHAQIVRDQITVPLTQGEFDALSSLAFNLGYIPKSLKACLNGGVTDAGKVMTPGSYGSALLQFPRNCRAAGKPLKGLYRRRLAEACLFSDLPWENACSISVIKLAVTEDGKIDPNETTSLEDTLMRARLDTSKPPDTSHIIKKPWSELIAKKAEPEAVPATGEADPPEQDAPQPIRVPAASAPPPIEKPALRGPALATAPPVKIPAPQRAPEGSVLPSQKVDTKPPEKPPIIAPHPINPNQLPTNNDTSKNMADSTRMLGMVIVGIGSVIQIISVRLGVGTAIGAVAFDLSRDPTVIALTVTAITAAFGWVTKALGKKTFAKGADKAVTSLY